MLKKLKIASINYIENKKTLSKNCNTVCSYKCYKLSKKI